ncbi:hypothetical protein J2N86_15060 (plasmid) [Legionella lytica]|uniref:Uncharacterized protein n=1 Tax=Legionella lytica TaxID=96232 RepID=A0ABY4YCB2_9GAMM|nr:hypothetical protein [Legionella lytica]USQ15279.1 hypothetical protein J2N86_15060 [Legionella lytica]
MRIYLDNNHIQELVKNQDLILAKKLKSHQIELLFSFINLLEITQGELKEKVLDVADFLEKCKLLYLKKPKLLFERELFIFLNKDSIDPGFITQNFNDCMEHSLTLGLPKLIDLIGYIKSNNISELIRLSTRDEIFNRKELFSRKFLEQWGKSNEGISRNWGSKGIGRNWKNYVSQNYMKQYINMISIINGIIHQIDDSSPSDFLSFSMCFFTQHIRHEQKGKKWTQNDFFDIQQCMAIPFVDYFVTDQGNPCASNQVKARLKKDIPCLSKTEIIDSLEMLELFLIESS